MDPGSAVAARAGVPKRLSYAAGRDGALSQAAASVRMRTPNLRRMPT